MYAFGSMICSAANFGRVSAVCAKSLGVSADEAGTMQLANGGFLLAGATFCVLWPSPALWLSAPPGSLLGEWWSTQQPAVGRLCVVCAAPVLYTTRVGACGDACCRVA
jgi:hypothetical protein